MTTRLSADFKDTRNARITSCERKIIVLTTILFAVLILSFSLQAQERFRSENSRSYQLRFRNQITKLSKACHLLEKKRTHKPKTKLAFFSKSKPKQYAEGTGRVLSNPDPKPKPSSKPVENKPPVTAHATEIPSPEKLEVLHKKEDEVLAENKLPKPTSAKHEQIRKNVQEHLKNKKDNEPIELAPLYFTFAEDEFSVVDMDPFLIAVEYALQGRIILIEGHTDSRGDANYNNQLSIKRVQRIRQLMIDMGVSDDHISIVGYGEGAPKHDNSSEEKRQLNRRVDFKAF
jgi:outer membrane protein OmpA-like peptidoglycan-associated protein